MNQELNDTKNHIKIFVARSAEEAESIINEWSEKGYTIAGMTPIQETVWIVMKWSSYLRDVRRMKGIAVMPAKPEGESQQ